MGDLSALAAFLKNVVLEGEVCYTFLKSPRNGRFGKVWVTAGLGSHIITYRTRTLSTPIIWSGLVWFVYTVSRCLARCSNMSLVWQISIPIVNDANFYAESTSEGPTLQLNDMLQKFTKNCVQACYTALRYVRRVQLGAYTWRKGLNSTKTGSNWAQNTCLCTPNGPGSLLEKHVFDPFLTHFWSQNGPFSRHLGILYGPKPVPTG